MRNHVTIPHKIQGVAKTMMSRSRRLADVDHIRAESSEMKHIIRTDDFIINAINRAFLVVVPDTTYVTKVYLPYIKGLMNKVVISDH
ncbi:hypothetical protein Trydic_g13177 [Trypoxylus dichotomus]